MWKNVADADTLTVLAMVTVVMDLMVDMDPVDMDPVDMDPLDTDLLADMGPLDTDLLVDMEDMHTAALALIPITK